MILDDILVEVRQGLADRKQRIPLSELEHLVDKYEAPRDFEVALQGEGVDIIAEIKRASPSKGWLCEDLDVTKMVQNYAQGGAAAVSVLTEMAYFKGGLADLTKARHSADLPVLRKDFIFDPYQVYEARVFGADAVLLIASILSLSELSALIELARMLGMASLVEVHNEQEVGQALDAGASLIGINNRNLADFSVDLGTAMKLRPLIPSRVTVVSESGIKSYADIVTLKEAGINAVLVGETLVSSPDPEAELKELRGVGG